MKKITYIFIIILFSTITFSQQFNDKASLRSDKNTQVDLQTFNDIESSIKEGNVAGISKYFGQQTYFSLSNGINGYYSSNQAFYVLEDFFKLYKVTSFKFDHIKNDKNSSYATGRYSYDNRGKRSVAQVYISLKKIGNNWNITQLTIN
ncbi:MAG TPA: DUF4783 domain-containing protein [Ignavibacteriaceae bacterium]|nr:DUF4783 domain-containing protein [Ignavibacteriaceae bacterium]